MQGVPAADASSSPALAPAALDALSDLAAAATSLLGRHAPPPDSAGSGRQGLGAGASRQLQTIMGKLKGSMLQVGAHACTYKAHVTAGRQVWHQLHPYKHAVQPRTARSSVPQALACGTACAGPAAANRPDYRIPNPPFRSCCRPSHCLPHLPVQAPGGPIPPILAFVAWPR